MKWLRIGLLIAAIAFQFVATAKADEPQKAFATIVTIDAYTTTGGYWREYLSYSQSAQDLVRCWKWVGDDDYANRRPLRRPYSIVTLQMRDGPAITVTVMHALFTKQYALREVVVVVKDREGRWHPIFEKLRFEK